MFMTRSNAADSSQQHTSVIGPTSPSPSSFPSAPSLPNPCFRPSLVNGDQSGPLAIGQEKKSLILSLCARQSTKQAVLANPFFQCLNAPSSLCVRRISERGSREMPQP
jgi:hypothetical protein